LTRVLYRELAAWLLPTALATDHGPTLVTTFPEELRARCISTLLSGASTVREHGAPNLACAGSMLSIRFRL
jgi:hypothetical protein